MADFAGTFVQHDSDRRGTGRLSCDLPIRIEWGAAEIVGRVRDISIGGMFVTVSNPLWIGARFLAEVTLAEPVQLECEVRRVEPRQGMALKYTAAGDAGRAALDSLLRTIAAE